MSISYRTVKVEQTGVGELKASDYHFVFLLFLVEIVKETCKDNNSGLLGPVKIRLYSPNSQKYICFSAKGLIRAVVSPILIFILAIPGLFLGLFSIFSNTSTYLRTILQRIIVINDPSSIWCWDSNSQPLEHASPPITTSPGSPSNSFS